MMMTTKELCSSYVSTLLPGPHVKEEAEILKYISESDDITSEIKYFRLGFGLGIPYHLVLQNLRDAASIDSVTTHPLLMKTAVIRLLYFARNVYLSAGNEKTHKYFYRVLIPGAMYVPHAYFEKIAETFNPDNPYGWDMTRTASPWFSEPLEFEAHLLHLISRLVSTDYAKHYNSRLHFLEQPTPWEYQYVDETNDLASLTSKYGSLGLVSGFFMRLGVVRGAEDMKTLLQNFYHHIYDRIDEPPHPDMRMLMYHGSMDMMKRKFKGRIWDFAHHFRDTCATDIRGMSIYIAARSMLYMKSEWVMGVMDETITRKFTEEIVRRPDTGITKNEAPQYPVKSENVEFFNVPVVFSWDSNSVYM